MTSTNLLVRAILIEQFRVGDVLLRVRAALDDGRTPDEQDAGLVRDYCGRLDGLVYALSVSVPNCFELCEVAGIPRAEIEESLARISPDFKVPIGFAGDLAIIRAQQAES